MPRRSHPSMEDLLPEEVMLGILSKLSVKSIMCCKCVCKKWENLVLELYISKSPECLLIYNHQCISEGKHPGTLKLVEIEQKLDENRLLRDPFMSLDMSDLFPESKIFPVGSVNGLICLWEASEEVDKTNIFNPVTREYMILPQQKSDAETYWSVRYGFGVSMATREYKVIRIYSDRNPTEIEVYTLGTDQWRTLSQLPSDLSGVILWGFNHGVFFNGYVHWIVGDRLFSFDLDNETYQLFSLPPPHGEINWNRRSFLGVLNGCLSLYSESYLGFTIWVMKEHGNEKSWHKKLDIKASNLPCQDFENWVSLSLIDGLNGRSILMVKLCEDDEGKGPLVAYYLETDTIENTKMSNDFFRIITYRPSFLKLRDFNSSKVMLEITKPSYIIQSRN